MPNLIRFITGKPFGGLQKWYFKTGEMYKCGGASASFWGGTWYSSPDGNIKPTKLIVRVNGYMQDNPFGGHAVNVYGIRVDGTEETLLLHPATDGQAWSVNRDVILDGKTIYKGIKLTVEGKTTVSSSSYVCFSEWYQLDKWSYKMGNMVTMTSQNTPTPFSVQGGSDGGVEPYRVIKATSDFNVSLGSNNTNINKPYVKLVFNSKSPIRIGKVKVCGGGCKQYFYGWKADGIKVLLATHNDGNWATTNVNEYVSLDSLSEFSAISFETDPVANGAYSYIRMFNVSEWYE